MGKRAAALEKGLEYLMAQQKDGMFPKQSYTWIHIQGFGALALSEAYGRSLLCKTKPKMDMKKVKETVGKATGDAKTEAEGKADQAAGNVKQAGEKVKDAGKSLKP